MISPTLTLDVTRNDLVFLKRDRQLPGQAHQRLPSGKWVSAFSGIERAARLKLDRLEAAVELRDLGALPGNRLEALKGDRKGQDSIRINDQWRICFEWPGDAPGPSNAEIVDYH